MFHPRSRGTLLLSKLGILGGIVSTGLPPAPVVLIPMLLGSAHQVAAQSRSNDFRITIPDLLQIATAAENPLHIDIAPRAAVPERAMILIKGLPSTIALSHGRLFDSGVWAVPVANLSELKMSSGSGAVGKTDFSITLVTVAGDVLAVSNSSLIVGGPSQGIQATASVQQADQVEGPREPTEPAVKLLPPQPTGKALERVMLYMEKGEASLKSGNLNVARAFFTQAAEEGWAEGALALGATYDPVELANMRLLGGVGPDPAMAKRWYETAAQLGSKAATTRLQRMTER
jgi:hypothetical protein